MSDVNAGSGAGTSGDKTSASTDGGGFAAVDAAASTPSQDSNSQGSGDDADDVGGRLRASLNKNADRAEEIRAWGAGRQDAARDLVEAKPLTVVGAAFGVGLLLGLVASRV